MAGIHCGVVSLDLFSKPLQQDDIIGGYYTSKGCSSTLNSSRDLEFIFEKSSDHYSDISKSFLELDLQVVKANGDPVEHYKPNPAYAEDKTVEPILKGADFPVAPINNIAHSLWARQRLMINEQSVSAHNYAAYESQFKYLFSNKQSTKDCTLKGLTGWRTDKPGFFDKETNPALESSCQELCKDGKVFKVICNPTFDLASSNRPIPNGSSMRMIFTRNSDQFVLMSFKENENYKLLIKDATYHLWRVILSPNAQMHLERSLALHPTVHHVKSLVMKPVNIEQGKRDLTIDSVFSSNYIPERLIVTMVRQEAYRGQYNFNPFYFQHFKVNEISINALGRSDHQYFAWDSEDGINQTVIPYKNFCDFLGDHSLCDSNFGIDKVAHENGNFFCVFDLSPNSSYKSGVASFDRQGSISLQMRFEGNGIAHNAVLLICGVFDNIYHQDINRTFTSPYIF